jgi:hypothetical protein
MSNLEVAETIIQQLGHSTRRLGVMIGAHTFVASDVGVSFKFKARAKNGANYCRVTLKPSDTYKVEFVSLRGVKVNIKGEFSDIYNDQLTRLFERETGLYLSL